MSIVQDFTTFILSRVEDAEKLFKDRPEVQHSKKNCDELYNEIFSILEKTGQQNLIRDLRKEQTNCDYWTIKGVYIQAIMDVNSLFLPKG